jgi:hypothetical protein
MEVAMTAHTRLPLRRFAMEHPYAADRTILVLVTLAALLLWLWNS